MKQGAQPRGGAAQSLPALGRLTLAAALIAAIAGSAAAGPIVVYQCGFEAGEAGDVGQYYQTGPLDGQDGWVADEDAVVQDALACAGTQALLMTANGPMVPDGMLVAEQTFDNPLPRHLVTVSQDVNISHDWQATWVIALMAGGDVQHTVAFDWLGGIFVDYVDTGHTWTAGACVPLVMAIDFQTGIADVSYDGTLISSAAISGTSSLGTDRIVILTDNYSDGTDSTMVYDDLLIQAIPEPATMVLLGLGLLGIVVRRTRST